MQNLYRQKLNARSTIEAGLITLNSTSIEVEYISNLLLEILIMSSLMLSLIFIFILNLLLNYASGEGINDTMNMHI